MTTEAQFVFTLEYVPDIEAARQFFVETLGLEVEREAPTFVQFKDRNGASFAVSSDETIGGRGEQEIYWGVADADAALQEISKRAEVTVPLRQMPFGKVFGINDPANQPHYFIEFSQSRPSQQAG